MYTHILNLHKKRWRDIMLSLIALISGFILDLFQPKSLFYFNPEQFIAKKIKLAEDKHFFINKNRDYQYKLGRNFIIKYSLLLFFCATILFLLLGKINIYLKLFVESISCYMIISFAHLFYSTNDVYNQLKSNNLKNKLPKIKSTLYNFTYEELDNYTESELVFTTIKILSTNICELVIAPIFYTTIGGVVFGLLYRLATIIKYSISDKGNSYMYFGWYTNSLIGFLNELPFIITINIVLFVSRFLGLDYKKAKVVYKNRKNKLTEGEILYIVCLALIREKHYEKQQLSHINGSDNYIFDNIYEVIKLLGISSLLFIIITQVIKLLVILFIKQL